MVVRSIALGMLLTWTVVPAASAHVAENMGLEEMPSPLPSVRNMPPIANQEVQRMAIDMKSADCEKLINLEQNVREAFFITQLFLQRQGSLSRIVGPKCTFLGPATKIAEVSDPALVLNRDREDMYYLDEMHAIIVTHKERDTIAYGMFYHGDDPVSYFLENRDGAERSARIAKIFLETTIEMEPFIGQAPSSRSPLIEFSASSEATTTVSSVPASVESSSTASLPTAVPTDGTESSATGVVTTTSSETTGAATSSAAAVVATSSSVPDIAPIGPLPPPPEEQNPFMLWLALLVFVVIVVALVAAYKAMRKQATANDVPTDEA